MSQAPPLSLYVHMPWCVRKCPYCDFNSHRAGDAAPFARYVAALVADIEREAAAADGRPVETIFIGGGTPSLFEPEQVETVLEACRRHLELTDDCEITMEANPGTVEHHALAGYRDAGVNRLSIGAQSFDADMLQALGRIHGPGEIVTTFEQAMDAGFERINLDLMFALPGQDLRRAGRDVAEALVLSPPHISYYQLTLEPNTVFHRRPPPGLPDDDLAWDIQEQGQAMLAEAGYEHYEISAYARPGHRCRHNLNYWQFGDYLAAGAGAHGKVTGADGAITRYRKPANPLAYMEWSEGSLPVAATERVDRAEIIFEFMLNALRLTDGFTRELFCSRTGLSAEALERSARGPVDRGLLERTACGYRPSERGFRFLNELQTAFLR